jgi:hypothetical protein
MRRTFSSLSVVARAVRKVAACRHECRVGYGHACSSGSDNAKFPFWRRKPIILVPHYLGSDLALLPLAAQVAHQPAPWSIVSRHRESLTFRPIARCSANLMWCGSDGVRPQTSVVVSRIRPLSPRRFCLGRSVYLLFSCIRRMFSRAGSSVLPKASRQRLRKLSSFAAAFLRSRRAPSTGRH